MTSKYKNETKNSSVVRAIGIGVLLSVVITLFAAGVIASLVVNEKCNENMIGALKNVTIVVSAFCGTLFAAKRAAARYALISGITVIVYVFLSFSIGVLFFKSAFNQPWTNLIATGLGGILACIIALKKSGNKRRTKSYHR